MKSSMQMSGQRNKSGWIDIKVIGMPLGSDGKVGEKPPSAVLMNDLAVWHLLTGIINASFTTTAISEPE